MIEKTYLYVEDDPLVSQTFTEFFLQNGATKVITAGSVKEGMQKIAENRFDIVILDYNLPDGEGIELCNKIRSMEGGNDLPVIMLTGERDRPVDYRDGIGHGADQFVTRPVSPEHLKAIIDGLFCKYDRVKQDTSESSLSVDSVRLRVRSNVAESPELTAIEFKLVCLFLETPGNPEYQPIELMKYVWNENKLNKKLNVHLHNINCKLRVLNHQIRLTDKGTYKVIPV